ncbi:AMP-binding protein [Mycolicibacter kumamotonensis]|uniref:AMP-binding protein n=1 Tax=Mycolicibacter kumamotonensis TaxID=354243 RepID=A0A1B8SGX8_9MYCO|nr:AMP-binding protein [Mycolicibacter kumamotonensis]NDJ87815.1 AMP-binding protein [Mycolicibacter kumamotonensis]OBY31963.1 acyl-CoA synthetase [Mycolicibacter kumamotonensis]ORA79329.1 acyl-CoA synthetase [Mycolicibacter kumamotonensis]
MKSWGQSIPALLRERAEQWPDRAAFTFLDYEVDQAGYADTLTWSQILGRTESVAVEVAAVASPGDRVALLAPQGLEYIAGFFGAMEAGCIVVPLPVPAFGSHDERVTAALKDCAPTAVLTTSAVVGDIQACINALGGNLPAIIEVDLLDLDSPAGWNGTGALPTKAALLQYTSGSTGSPRGVVVSHRNVFANIEQVMQDYFGQDGGAPPEDTTLVSWLPFYHDMGLLLGVMGAVTLGRPSVVMSPIGFLQKPARWIQQLAINPSSFTAGPNFAFELAARRTTDEDMAGLDLGGVHTILSGSERIHAATIRRFTERFARFNLPANALSPSYGLAEAMVYVASAPRANRPVTVRLNYEKLVAGTAEADPAGADLVSIGAPRACTVRIVDPETRTECPDGRVGEIWIHGPNVASGYWHNPEATERTFGGRLDAPTPGTPAQPWLRTGDLGVIHDGEMLVVGRIKDLLIVDGRNHYPDDIEATVQELTGGRVAAVPVTGDGREQLVVIAELKSRGTSDEEAQRIQNLKHEVSAAVSRSHGVRVSDLMFVAPGSLPITTSGKIRRSTCADCYRSQQFSRLEPIG